MAERTTAQDTAREILRQARYRADTPRGEGGWVSNAYEILERDIATALESSRLSGAEEMRERAAAYFAEWGFGAQAQIIRSLPLQSGSGEDTNG